MADDIRDMQAVIDAARQGCAPVPLIHEDGVHVVFLPGAEGGKGSVIDLDRYYPLPARKRGTITVFDAASFNQLLKDNASAGDAAIYLDRNPNQPRVVAVLNGNGPNGPGWGDLRVQIVFRPTPQWEKWKARDGQLMAQVDFAEFLEENLEDVAEPDGATMLEIASQLQLVRTVNFRSKVVLQGGTFNFTHDQDDKASVGAGQIEVPQQFVLGIAPVFGLAAYRVPARFRYRVVEGKLKLGFKLQRVETMMAQIVEDVIAKIELGANVSVMDGLPP